MLRTLLVLAVPTRADQGAAGRAGTVAMAAPLALPAVAVREAAAQVARPVPATQAVAGLVTKAEDQDPTAGDEAPKATAVERPLALAGPTEAT